MNLDVQISWRGQCSEFLVASRPLCEPERGNAYVFMYVFFHTFARVCELSCLCGLLCLLTQVCSRVLELDGISLLTLLWLVFLTGIFC